MKALTRFDKAIRERCVSGCQQGIYVREMYKKPKFGDTTYFLVNTVTFTHLPPLMYIYLFIYLRSHIEVAERYKFTNGNVWQMLEFIEIFHLASFESVFF